MILSANTLMNSKETDEWKSRDREMNRGLTLRPIFTVGGSGPLYREGRLWGTCGGVSCAQRLALPMGLNGPFLCTAYRAARVCIATARKRKKTQDRTAPTGNGPPRAIRLRKAFVGVLRRPLGFGISPISLPS